MTAPITTPMQPEDFEALDLILEDLRERYDETPQWEFCEGFMAAVVCCRRVIPASLSDERAYTPEVLDVRAMMLSLSPEERAEALAGEEDEGPLPSFGQVWALGFMFAVEAWPDEWEAPAKDKEAVQWLDAGLSAIVALTEDDTGPAEVSAFGPEEEGGEEPPPSMSEARMEAFGEAMWAVYDLRELWRSLGPRVEQVRKEPTPGRNDICPCGSGKKYKKCHGAT
jgi:uncharacterized protein